MAKVINNVTNTFSLVELCWYFHFNYLYSVNCFYVSEYVNTHIAYINQYVNKCVLMLLLGMELYIMI